MRTTVLDEGRHFDRQTHAYAEYRVFSALARDECGSRLEVTVTLARLDANGSADERILCAIAVSTDCGRPSKVRALERHPYPAIDRAAALIARALRRERRAARPEEVHS